jgi:hypothetical protein
VKQDPVRLFDDPQASQTLRADLRAAKQDPGPRYDLEAETRRFRAQVASEGTAGTAGTAATTGATAAAGGAAKVVLPFGLKVVGLVVIAVVGAAGAVRVLSTSDTGVSADSTSALSSLDTRPPVRGVAQPSAAPGPPATTLDAPTGSPAKPRPTTSSAVRRVPPSAARPAATSPAVPTLAPALTPDVPSPPAPDGSALKEEMAQLAEIRSLARTHPARAVEMVGQGHARFAQGVFWQERELLAITSLVSLGRQDDARQRASAVLKRHPESPFAETLRRVISGAAAPALPAAP